MDAKQLKEYIIQNEDCIITILEDLGFHKVVDRGGYVTCALPDHNNPSAFSVLKENLYCNSFSTHLEFKGNIFELVQQMKGKTFGQSIYYIHKLLGLKYDYSKNEDDKPKDSILDFFKKYKTKPNKRSTKEKELKFYTDEEVFGMYVRCPYANWIKEGIIARTQEEFGIGYDFGSNRIVIPHRYWKTGEIIGLIGRTLQSAEICDMFGIPKYFPIIPYKKGCNLYGLWENRQYIEQAKEVIVFEAEKSVLKMSSKGIRNTCCVCCHDLSEEQVKILIGLNVNIVLAYDEDIPLEFMESEAKKFKGLRNVSIVINQYDVLKDKQSPADSTLKIWEALYKRRINYKYKAN